MRQPCSPSRQSGLEGRRSTVSRRQFILPKCGIPYHEGFQAERRDRNSILDEAVWSSTSTWPSEPHKVVPHACRCRCTGHRTASVATTSPSITLQFIFKSKTHLAVRSSWAPPCTGHSGSRRQQAGLISAADVSETLLRCHVAFPALGQLQRAMTRALTI